MWLNSWQVVKLLEHLENWQCLCLPCCGGGTIPFHHVMCRQCPALVSFPQFSDWKQLLPLLPYSLQVKFVGLKIQIFWLLQLKTDLIKQIFSILNNELVPLETFHCIPTQWVPGPQPVPVQLSRDSSSFLTHWRPLSPGHLCPVRRESWSHLLPAEAAKPGPPSSHVSHLYELEKATKPQRNWTTWHLKFLLAGTAKHWKKKKEFTHYLAVARL